MNFTEPRYVLFLAAVLVLYYQLNSRARLWMLIAASYLFYSAWKPEYAFLMLAVTLIGYLSALQIEKANTARQRRSWLLLTLAGCLGMLFYFKYTDFALRNLARVLSFLGLPPMGDVTLGIILPVGISFFTFQALSYVIDVYKKRIPAEKRLDLVLCYIAFFPQLVAGPIERASHLIPQLRENHRFEWNNIRLGVQLIFWGLIKKCVFGDRFYEFGMQIINMPGLHPPPAMFAGMLAVSAWIYLDFSSYTDIARGSARLLGIDLMENFRQPYLATNLADFWSRWHISLTSWVTDYMYRPLLRVMPRGTAYACLASVFCMMLMGAWHGASWNFILWGTIHGVFLAGRYVRHRIHRPAPPAPGWRGRLTMIRRLVITQSLWIITGVLFVVPNIKAAWRVYAELFHWTHDLSMNSIVYLITWGALAIVFYVFHILKARYSLGERINTWHPAFRAAFYMACYYLLFFGSMAATTEYKYFQF